MLRPRALFLLLRSASADVRKRDDGGGAGGDALRQHCKATSESYCTVFITENVSLFYEVEVP